MNIEIKEEIRRAEESLNSAKILFENGLYRDAISRGYYSMYHAAKALLLLKGLIPKKHSGIIKLLGLHFVNEGILEVWYAKAYTKAFDMRTRADYDVTYIPTEEEAQDIIENAERFLLRVKELARWYDEQKRSS